VLAYSPTVNYAGPEGDGTEIADMDVPSKRRARADADKLADDAVVIDRRPGVDDTVVTYAGAAIYDSTGHNDSAIANLNASCDLSRWMNRRDEVDGREVFTGALRDLAATPIVANGSDQALCLIFFSHL